MNQKSVQDLWNSSCGPESLQVWRWLQKPQTPSWCLVKEPHLRSLRDGHLLCSPQPWRKGFKIRGWPAVLHAAGRPCKMQMKKCSLDLEETKKTSVLSKSRFREVEGEKNKWSPVPQGWKRVMMWRQPVWWLILWANLVRLWCPVICSNTGPVVTGRYFIDGISSCDQLTLMQGDDPPPLWGDLTETVGDLNGQNWGFPGIGRISVSKLQYQLLLESSACQLPWRILDLRLQHSLYRNFQPPHSCEPIPYNKSITYRFMYKSLYITIGVSKVFWKQRGRAWWNLPAWASLPSHHPQLPIFLSPVSSPGCPILLPGIVLISCFSIVAN